jgi:DNA-binding NarL/FixJ family response regulator
VSAKGDRTHVGGKPKPLTERDVDVERRLNAGETPTAIARDMGISAKSIGRIRERLYNVRSLEKVRVTR